MKTRQISETSVEPVRPLSLKRRTVLGIGLAATVLWITAIFLWMQVGVDRWVLASHTGLRANEIVAGAGRLATRYGMSTIVLVYLVYLLCAFRRATLHDGYRIYLLVILMFAFAGVGGDLLKEIVDRPRPFVEYAAESYALPLSKSPSFPSGHATKSVALALPFLLFITAKDGWHKVVKALLVILALGVCYSRVMLGAHYASDVLAGVGMALIWVPLVTLLANKLLARMNSRVLARAVFVWAGILVGLMLFMTVA